MRLERIACRRGFKETEYACGDFFVESESERTYTALELDETISIVRECAQQACLIFYAASSVMDALKSAPAAQTSGTTDQCALARLISVSDALEAQRALLHASAPSQALCQGFWRGGTPVLQRWGQNIAI